jgi:hypothetical protein
VGPPQGSREKDSGLSQNFIGSLLTRLSLRSNTKRAASNYLTIANNEPEIMWTNLEHTPRMVPMLAESKTAPLTTNQNLYHVSHESVSKIDRITGLLFQCSQP